MYVVAIRFLWYIKQEIQGLISNSFVLNLSESIFLFIDHGFDVMVFFLILFFDFPSSFGRYF